MKKSNGDSGHPRLTPHPNIPALDSSLAVLVINTVLLSAFCVQ